MSSHKKNSPPILTREIINVRTIIFAFYAFFVCNSVKRLIDVVREQNDFIGLSGRFAVVIILIGLSLLSFQFYYKVVTKFKESRFGEILSVITIIAFGLLLYCASNYDIFSFITLGLLVLLIKCYQLFRFSKSSGLSKIVLNYFLSYCKIYTIAIIISCAICLPIDTGWLKYDLTYNKKTPEIETTRDVIKELKIQISNTKAADEEKVKLIESVTTIEKNSETIYTQLRAASRNFYTSLVLIGLTLVIYFIYLVYSLYKSISRRKDDLAKDELEYSILEEIETHFHEEKNTNMTITQFTKIKSLLIISRPIVSCIAALISSSIYYRNTLSLTESITLFIVVCLTTFFGFSLNDFFDAEKDKINHKRRPLVIGQITKQTVLNYSLFISAFSLLLALTISTYVFFITAFVITLLSIYSYVNNKYGIIANVITSLCASCTLLISKLDLNLDIIFFTSVASFFLILSREIMFDVQDIEADKHIKKTSFPILFGKRWSFIISSINLFIFSVIIFLALAKYAGLGDVFFLSIALANILIWYAHLRFILSPTQNNALVYTSFTRFAFIMLIPAVLLH